MQEYNLTELVDDVCRSTGDNRREDVEKILSTAFNHLAINVADKGRVEIQGFGVLDLVPRLARSGTLFGDLTKRWRKIEHYAIVFRPGPQFLEIANEYKSTDFAQIQIQK